MWNFFTRWMSNLDRAFAGIDMTQGEILAAEVAELRERIAKLEDDR
jgi:hypothetical protein